MERDIPNGLSSFLQINRNNSNHDTARLKIIKHHLCGDFDMQPFIDMEMNVLPQAISWMAKDCNATDGRTTDEVNGHLYNFLRRMPTVFGV